ncbi:early boundary activity protein 2-like [Manduca sexta]|uniref:early boundary activity protein 2-like n=1 Tax=Manduca sexta TaxID=7130 RepID=UPI00188F7D92|nr:early boundary activity protein 2-like [Manduca sexta]
MSAISMNSGNIEYDAAQALLDLQSNIRESSTSQSSITPRFQPKEDMERAAKLFLSCIIASNPPTPASVPESLLENNNNTNSAATIRFPAALKKDASHERNIDTRRAKEKIAKFYHKNPQRGPESYKRKETIDTTTLKIQHFETIRPKTTIENSNLQQKIKTRDIATQTDDYYQLPQIENMEATIKSLSEKIKSLEAQIERTKSQKIIHGDDKTTSEAEMEIDEDEISSYEQSSNDLDTTLDKTFTKNSSCRERSNSIGKRSKEETSCKVLKNHNVNTKSNEIVPIGDGHASVPSRLLRHINWNSYTSATRKLLTAVFSRRILATHSLTGKPSPAFPNKPAKKKLDPALVNDIVQTVVEKCCVPENVVRTSITTKCADESKMYRTRQKNVKKRKHKVNRENIPPDTSDSDEF